jgi:hypothetical protein
MSTNPNNCIPLHRFVDDLTMGLLPFAVSRKTIIINQIDRDLEVGADENMLAYVLWNLLDRAVSSTQNECIHVESACNEGQTMIIVRNAGVYLYRSLSQGFRQIQYAAEKLGGSIHIDYSANNSPTIAFSMRDGLSAA